MELLVIERTWKIFSAPEGLLMACVVTLVIAFCRLFGTVAGTFEFYFVIP